MTTASHPAGHPVPQTPAADVLAELTAVLAGMTGTDAHLVDPGLPFPLLGLDSMGGVEFLAALGARHGTRIGPGALAEHPTPAALAAHIAGLLGAPASPALPAPAPVRPAAARDDAVLTVLRTQLARILRCAPGDLDDRAPFTVLGLDSILAAEFVEGINRTWGLKEQAALFYDHPDLTTMAAHLTTRLTGASPTAGPAGEVGAAGAAGAPAGTARPATAAAGPAATAAGAVTAEPTGALAWTAAAETAGAAGGTAATAGPPGQAATAAAAAPPLDLDALLDAVRDDVLGIDEAAALLASRTA